MNWLPLRIAWRYLISKKSHTAVSIISAISVCAVAITALAMVCVMSVFNGFSGLVNEKLSQLDPEIKVSAMHGASIVNRDSLLAVIRGVDGVDIAEPVIECQALAMYGDKQVPVVVKAVTDKYNTMTRIEDLVKEDGQYRLRLGEEYLSVISVGTAVSLGAHPGFVNKLEIYTPKRKGAVNPANPMSAFKRVEALVSGVFEVQQQEYDQNYIITSLELSEYLFDYQGEATAIEIAVAEGTSVGVAMNRIANAIGEKYVVENRLMQHKNSLKMINSEKWMTLLLLGFILVIASFNIISTLAIIITEKNNNISTLRALGAENKMISRIFVIEGWLISVVGAIAGVILGIILCLIQQYCGIIKMGDGAAELIIDTYPVIVEFTDILLILGIVAFVGLLTSQATALAMRRRLKAS